MVNMANVILNYSTR
uniref:Uncharacterized protein n=1 Tax=Romanomermis culicivorax TaxID=13658 RepID=A0A915I4E1_ROMCU